MGCQQGLIGRYGERQQELFWSNYMHILYVIFGTCSCFFCVLGWIFQRLFAWLMHSLTHSLTHWRTQGLTHFSVQILQLHLL
jgi:hypothetical protein